MKIFNYCEKCGTKLKVLDCKLANYDSETGKPRVRYIKYKCPNSRFWEYNSWNPHTNEWVITEIKEIEK